jgi:hypothetical protein
LVPPAAVRDAVPSGAPESSTPGRQRDVLSRSDEFDRPPGACLAARQDEAEQAEAVAREVFVRVRGAEHLALVQLLWEPTAQPPLDALLPGRRTVPIAPLRARQVERAWSEPPVGPQVLRELLDGSALQAWAVRLQAPLPVWSEERKPKVLWDAAQQRLSPLVMQPQPEPRACLELEARPVLPARPKERKLRALPQRGEQWAPGAQQAWLWPSWPPRPRLPGQPTGGNACAPVRRAGYRVNWNAFSSRQRRSRADTRSELSP